MKSIFKNDFFFKKKDKIYLLFKEQKLVRIHKK